MMGLISCYSELALQVSQKPSCSTYKTVTNSISPNLTPATQTTVTNVYTTTLSTGVRHQIAVTWWRSAAAHGLHITSGDDPTTGFRLNTSSTFFRKKKGIKSFQINDSKFEVVYDLSSAVYAAGAEAIGGYYVVITVDSEVALVIGDSPEDAVVKRVKTHKSPAKFALISRREHFSGDTLYYTKAQFSDAGSCHDVLIRCTGEDDGLKSPTLSVYIDKRVAVRVKRLRWNFRGNHIIFVDGLQVDLMWDVHDWFFNPGSGPGAEPGAGSGSGRAVFMFRTRNGSDSRLWLEDEVKTKDEKNKKEFSLLVYATKS